MDLLERIIFFAVGAGMGFILGFTVARLRSIEEKLDRVEMEVHDVDITLKRSRNEMGAFKRPTITQTYLFIVLVVTVFAAFSAAVTNQNLRETVDCLTRYNTNQNETLNSRDQAIKDETQAEIFLWSAYAELYELGVDGSPQEQARIQRKFLDDILEYRDQLVETQRTRALYTYDDPDVLKNCEERTR